MSRLTEQQILSMSIVTVVSIKDTSPWYFNREEIVSRLFLVTVITNDSVIELFPLGNLMGDARPIWINAKIRKVTDGVRAAKFRKAMLKQYGYL